MAGGGDDGGGGSECCETRACESSAGGADGTCEAGKGGRCSFGGGGGGGNTREEGEAGLERDAVFCGDGGSDGGGGGRTDPTGRMIVFLWDSQRLCNADLREYATSGKCTQANDRARVGWSSSRTRSEVVGASPLATVGSDEGVDEVLLRADDCLSLLLEDFLCTLVLIGDFVEADRPTTSLCDACLPRPSRDLGTDACRRGEESGITKGQARE